MAVSRARAGHTRLIFDIDYRPVFWGLVAKDGGASRYVDSATVTAASQRFLADCDLIVGTEEEIHIAGGDADTIGALRALRARSPAPIVLKRGAAGCVVFDEGPIPDSVDAGIVGPGFPVEVFNVVGAGDGFLSGFLSGWLRGADWLECCRRGNATGALVVSRHGCSPASPTRLELEWFLKGGASDPALHRSAELAYLHRATTRRARPSPVVVLTADQVAPFELLPLGHGRTIADLKSLLAEVARRLAPTRPELGVLFDDVEGEDALYRIGTDLRWVGRRLESAGPAPLRFRDDKTAAVLLSGWPRHQIATCLVPLAGLESQAVQDERLRELAAAANLYGIEFLLELMHDDRPGEAAAAASRIRAIQALGARPDWWMLPAFSEAAGWAEIDAAIFERNPMCRGVLLLDGGRELDEPRTALRSARAQSCVRGFAIGRTLWLEPATEWLAARIDDAEFARRLSERYVALVSVWTAAGAAAAGAVACAWR